ncbi:MAG: DUF488 domain-containing protein [Phycisphaerae bacterium]|jgi:uncharacterized protein (DUF488 family)
MANELFTVGYEGIDINSFVEHLRNKGIDCLIDVREIPLSRKKGFSKAALRARLEQENIRYVHLKELGSPKPVRNKLKEDGDYVRFFKAMKSYLADKKDVIEKAYQYVVSKTCCLMCFEHLASQCHRNIVATKIKERDGNGLLISNI